MQTSEESLVHSNTGVRVKPSLVPPDIAIHFDRLFVPCSDDVRDLAAHNTLAIALQEHGAYATAELLYRFIDEALVKSQSPRSEERRAAVLLNLGTVLEAQRRWSDAEACYRRVVGLYHKLLGSVDIAIVLSALSNLSSVLKGQGKLNESCHVMQQLLTTLEENLGARHTVTLHVSHDLAGMLHEIGETSEAVSLYEHTLQLQQEALGPTHPDTLATQEMLAATLGDLQQHAAALTILEEVLSVRIHRFGSEHPATLRTQNNLGYFLYRCGRHEEAEAYLRCAWLMQESALGPQHEDTLASTNNLAMLLQATGRFDEAAKLLRKVLRYRRQQHGPDHIETLIAMHNLGVLLLERSATPAHACAPSPEDASKAERLLAKTVAAARRSLSAGDAYRAYFESWYGKSLALCQQQERAEQYAQRGYEVLCSTLGHEHERTRKALEILHDVRKGAAPG